MDNFLFAFRANAPILLTILCGAVFSALVKWDKAYFKKMNVVAFRFLIPVQMFYNVYTIRDIRAVNWRMILFFVIATFICIAMGILTARLTIRRREQKCVIIQASFRSNVAVIGTSLVSALCTNNTADSMALTSLSICALAIVNNIVAVIVLKYYGEGAKSVKDILLGIVTNPLVIGSVSGLLLVLARELFFAHSSFTLAGALPSVFKVISSFAGTASPIALFCLGAMLDFKAGRAMLREIFIGVNLRLVLCPVTVFALAALFRNAVALTNVDVPALVAVAASPLAVSSAIMVQEMGGDCQLANHLVVWSSVFSMLTLFCYTLFLRSIGWL